MKPSVRLFRRGLSAVACGLVLAAAAQAAPTLLPATPTAVAGTERRMISYRHQNHMWQTADGAVHVVVNLGTQTDGAALRLYTSIDNGVSWAPGPWLSNTDANSTSDGFLVGNTLFSTYALSGGGVGFSSLAYDETSRSWSIARTETVYASREVLAVNPAVARDGLGRFWVGFTTMDRASGAYDIRLWRRDRSGNWVDTGLSFGGPDTNPLLNERSARPVAVAGGMGMVYTLHGNMFWARRSNSDPDAADWSREQIYSQVGGDIDPYGSHFSVVVDASSNVHVAMADASKLWYMRMLNSTQAWRPAVQFQAPVQVAYMQVLVAGSRLMMVTNNKTQLSVYQSADNGARWTQTHVLTHPVGDADYSNPRNEAPSNTTLDPVPVLQQFVDLDGLTQRLMSFRVPVMP